MVGQVRRIRVVLFTEANSKFGDPLLEDLLDHPDVDVAGVVTSPVGRLCEYYAGEKQPADVPARAGRCRVPVLRPVNVNAPDVVAAIVALQPDYLIIGNYQQILRKELLRTPQVAVINFHPSPLPRYAGLAPFFWMAMHGERDAGVSAVVTAEGIDAGPILAQRPVRLSGTETCGQIRDVLFSESQSLWRSMIPRLVQRDLRATPQDPDLRTYFSAPSDADRTLEWNQAGSDILGKIRACSPVPGAMVADWPPEIRVYAAAAVSFGKVPLARPGTVITRPGHGILIACTDCWIRLVTIAPLSGSDGQSDPAPPGLRTV